jgi:CRP-like cAMP-binding protein
MKTPPPLTTEDCARMDLFRGLAPAALARVAARAKVRRLAQGALVFAQGTAARHCHILLDGRVRITQSDGNGAQVVVRFIGPGETFGIVPLFTDGRYPARAVSVVDCVEVRWTEAALFALMRCEPGVAFNIIGMLGARIVEVQERLRELATQRVERRVAHALLRLAAQAGMSADGGTTIAFPLRRKDVADMCGATLHTVSRILTAWEKAGLIASRRQRITLRRPGELRRLAHDALP